MKHAVAVAALVVAVGLVAVTSATTPPPNSAATPVASPTTCPITQPNGNEPPGEANVFGRGVGNDGNAFSWTSLWIWGEERVDVPPTHVHSDGSLGGMKWAWRRYVPGKLTIEGRRLDAFAPPLRADIPDGNGEQGFQATGLIFPTAGCWEVIGRGADGSLTFVVLVVAPSVAATPDAAP